MNNLIIRYKIAECRSEISDVSDIEGGICVQYSDDVITKPLNNESDGYIGNFLFYEVWDWIGGIPDIVNNKMNKVKILESFIAFRFVPKDDFVYFSIVNDTSDEDMLKPVSVRYPGGMGGYPLPVRPFIEESIKMGKEVLRDIKNYYPELSDSDNVRKFAETLKEVEDIVKISTFK